MGDLGKTVGTNQKLIRTERGMSLDALAKASGVSRSRLSQIESGDANPSIGTVWQIASALKVGFSELVSASEERSRVVHVLAEEPSTSDDGKYRAYSAFAFDPALGFELYTIEIDPGGELTAEPHPGGTQETVSVSQGDLTIEVDDESFMLGPGDAVRFRADQVHSYRNSGSDVMRCSMTLSYSRRG